MEYIDQTVKYLNMKIPPMRTGVKYVFAVS